MINIRVVLTSPFDNIQGSYSKYSPGIPKLAFSTIQANISNIYIKILERWHNSNTFGFFNNSNTLKNLIREVIEECKIIAFLRNDELNLIPTNMTTIIPDGKTTELVIDHIVLDIESKFTMCLNTIVCPPNSIHWYCVEIIPTLSGVKRICPLTFSIDPSHRKRLCDSYSVTLE